MSDTKPGKVIRVSPTVWRLLSRERKGSETIDSVVRRLLGLSDKKGKTPAARRFFILTESRVVCDSVTEARGVAVLHAVRGAKGTKPIVEKPIEVREVI